MESLPRRHKGLWEEEGVRNSALLTPKDRRDAPAGAFCDTCVCVCVCLSVCLCVCVYASDCLCAAVLDRERRRVDVLFLERAGSASWQLCGSIYTLEAK